jgi:CheY-like chemotaxis protein
MARRIDELRGLRSRLVRGEASAFDEARRVAQALRGSGGTFGFPELSAVSQLVETAPDSETLAKVEGLIEYLRRLRADPGSSRVHAEWLARAGGVSSGEGFLSLAEAWSTLAASSGLGARALAERAAAALGVGVADLSRPSRSTLRLLPETLMRATPALPFAEDGETVTVATADPTSLVTELELRRLTGRRPRLVVAPPDELERALTLLLDHAPEDAPLRRRAPPAATLQAEVAGKVLVVDDDAASRRLARAVLERNGHAVVEAGNGLEALDRLRAEPAVGLVIADLNMPEFDGLELIWEIRDAPHWSHIPVIVLTGETDALLESQLIEEGADDYLSKPIDPRLFIARVGATIRRSGEQVSAR